MEAAVKALFTPAFIDAARQNLGPIMVAVFTITGGLISGTWGASTWWYGAMVDQRIEQEMVPVNRSLERIEDEARSNTLLLDRLLCIQEPDTTFEECELRGRSGGMSR